MRFVRVLDEVLGSRARVAVLRTFATAGGREFTGRELARLTALDHKTCNVALAGLADQGLVRARRAGRAILYGLASRHALFESALAPLFDAERGLLERLGREIHAELGRARTRPTAVAVFGSVARGDETAGSDLDLLVVTPAPIPGAAAEHATDRVAALVADRYAMAAQVFFETGASLERKFRRRDPLARSMVRDGRVIHGEDLLQRLRRG
jgi:predicted nucleotidyltransferase